MAYYRRRRRRIFRRRAVYRRRRRYGAGRRYRRRRGMKMSIRRMPRLLPDAIRVTLKYQTDVAPTNITGGFIANYCINDPFYNAGYLPLGWDQWAAFYNYFYINTAKFILTVRLNGVEPGVLYVFPNSDASAVSTDLQAAAMPYSKMLMYGDTSGNSARNRLTHKMSISKLLGQPLRGENWHGLTSSGLTINANRCFWNIYGSADDGTVDDIDLNVQIYFYCKFYRRKVLSLTSN